MNSMETPCKVCRRLLQSNEMHCPKCGSFDDFPNVKLARAEHSQLCSRAKSARESARAAGADVLLDELEVLAASTRAVLNMSASFAHLLLASDDTLYSSYRRLVGTARRPAQPQNDRDRVTVEGKLYGSSGGEVVYAALAAGPHGLISYDPISVTLTEQAVMTRSSLLEENSYSFAKRHDLRVLGPMPTGYLATWDNRAELVIAKLGSTLTAGLEPTPLADWILRSDGDRETDEFIEVHIWGGVHRDGVEGMAVSDAISDEDEQAFARLAKAKALSRGICWQER
jgi:hypothetical protein